jgi:hypothetical protein
MEDKKKDNLSDLNERSHGPSDQNAGLTGHSARRVARFVMRSGCQPECARILAMKAQGLSFPD